MLAIKALRLFLITHLTLISAALVSSGASAPPNAIQPRKVTDQYLACMGKVPQATTGWPAELQREDYPSMLKLCGASGGARRNIGCYCGAAAAILDCNTASYDAELGQTQTSDLTLLRVCQQQCRCVPPEVIDVNPAWNIDHLRAPRRPRPGYRRPNSLFSDVQLVSVVEPEAE